MFRDLPAYLRTRGLARTVREFPRYLKHRRLRHGYYTDYYDAESAAGFDARFETDTTGIVEAYQFGRAEGSGSHRYEAVSVESFEEAIAAVGSDVEGAAFIDIGAGKGRAVLLASHLPFRELVALDLSAEMLATTASNFERYQPPEKSCHELTTICHDALQYELPDEPLVLYLFNPFSADVMTAFVERVEASLERSPRMITVLYVNPICAAFAESGAFELRAEGSAGRQRWQCFRSRSGA